MNNGKNSLLRDCNLIVENKNLDKLFLNLDNVLDYLIKDKLEEKSLFISLYRLGGKPFANVTMNLLLNYDVISFEKLFEEGVDRDLLEHYKYILAKYGLKLNELLEKERNDLGWKSIISSVVSYSEDYHLAEYEIILNNESKYILRDHPDAIVQLATNLLKGVTRIPDIELDEEMLETHKNQLEDLIKKVK